jgi:hypothetical protein
MGANIPFISVPCLSILERDVMNEHLTAISRGVPSVPMRYLYKAGLLVGDMLDFGSGKGFDAKHYCMCSYDPYYQPVVPGMLYNTITCNYVLNVIEQPASRETVLANILAMLTDDGTAYITVRNDKAALKGTTSKGTWQGHITLDLPVEHKCKGYIIYRMEKG